ncbi:MAG: hypothetical protein KBF91_03795 [Alphaproteobacteria bacterium]|nr:hypothetical protein [Alphaproteobacteria bacterium]
MRKNINQVLTKLGLRANEQKVYLFCLAHQEGLFAQEISDLAEIKRSSVDLLIDRLLTQGFLARQKIGRRYRFLAQNPETILFRREQILEDFKNLIPTLNRLHASSSEIDIRFFEGPEGIRQMYQEGMLTLRLCEKKDQYILAITSGVDLTKIIPDFETFWTKRRVQQKIPVRIISPKNSESVSTMTNDPTKLRQVKRFDDSALPYRIGIEIFSKEIVGIFSVSKPVRGIVIRDPVVAQSFACLFEILWTNLPETA